LARAAVQILRILVHDRHTVATMFVDGIGNNLVNVSRLDA
jgi:hypothetical protein